MYVWAPVSHDDDQALIIIIIITITLMHLQFLCSLFQNKYVVLNLEL